MKALKIILKILIIAVDVALIPCMILCRMLSGMMLSYESTCLMAVIKGKCLTCGGTHFVRDLLTGKIFDAFMDNHFLFLCTMYLLITLVVINLCVLFKVEFAKKMLKYMYSIPALIIFFSVMILFMVLRNIPMWIYLGELFYLATRKIGEAAMANDRSNIKNGAPCDLLFRIKDLLNK